MAHVNRSNPNTQGMGCPDCGGAPDCFMSPHYGYAAAQSDRDMPGLTVNRGVSGLGASISQAPTDSGPTTAYIPGTAANALLNSSPDPINPTALSVFDSFSNDVGGAQPGVLQLSPNGTANNLSFIRPPEQSMQCKVISTLNSNPLLFVAGTFALFYFMNEGQHKAREYHARRKAAKK